MKYYFSCFLVLVLGVAILGSAKTTQAAGGAFDPNNLISDQTFTSANAMSVDDIQNFLVAKGSVLATISPSKLGDGANGRTAAKIIYDSTRGNFTGGIYDSYAGYNSGHPLALSLNPQVILATLQKEQSLITTNTEAQLNQFSLQSAMGMLCPDSGGCSSDAYGFFKQVMMGSAQLMINFIGSTNCMNFRAGSTVTIDNTTVTFASAATAALYCYTPHLNGNSNFVTLMNAWFNPVAYNPPLALDPAVNTVYAIDDNGRWPVSGQGFIHWGFSWQNVQPITPAQLALPIRSTYTQLAKDDFNTVWYMDNGRKRPITSARVFDKWGFKWSDVSYASNAILDKVPTGLPTYELVLPTSGDGTVYLATNSTLYPISGETFFNSWRFNPKEIGKVPGYVTANLNQGPILNRVVITQGGDGTAFVLDRGYAYRLSGAVQADWKLDLSHISTVGAGLITERTIGNLTTLASQEGGDGTIFLIKNGQKLPISHAAWVSRGYRMDDVRILSAGLMGLLPSGDVLQ